MGTLVAVRTDNSFVLAADALNLMEEIVNPTLNVANSCIVRLGDSLLGFNCSYAYQQAAELAISAVHARALPTLESKEEIRKFFQGLHDVLKSNYQFFPAQQPGMFEASPMNALVANRAGIFKVDSSRAVYEFTNFWAVGSGEAFALGALHAIYDTSLLAEQLARRALAACGEFEANRGRNVEAISIRTPTLRLSHTPVTAVSTNAPIPIESSKRKLKKKQTNRSIERTAKHGRSS